jgi:exonuclease V gamma subunit
MFFLAETPKALLDHACERLAGVRDVRARHWLICAGRGRSEYLLQKWAASAGIASHSQEIDLRVLLEQIAATDRPHFDFDRLRLAVCGCLPRVAAAGAEGLPVPRSLPLSPVSASVLSWASTLSKVLDEALQCRDGAARWGDSGFLRTIAEDSEVAAALATHPGMLSEDEFETSIHAWIQGWTAKGGVPHLWIQLDAGLPSLQFRRLLHLLDTLGRAVPGRVHLFALAPSRHFWADLKLRSASRKAGILERDPELHPGGLLWAFGRCCQDLQKQLSETLQATGDGGTDLGSEPIKDSLLGRLQASCREAAPIAPGLRTPLAPGDCSLTIHSTHTRMREMEVCRDRILQALEEIEGLRYEDILLLLASPKEQAPFVEAAFQGSSECRLPFRILGFGQAVPSSFASSLEFFLETLGGRFTLETLQTLLESPLIAEKFGLNQADDEGRMLVTWLGDAQFRWGLTPEHRLQFQDVPENRWNLLWALGRLGLGAVVEEGRRDVPIKLGNFPFETLPLERASGLGLRPLAKLAAFVRRLLEVRDQWNLKPARPVSEWNQIAASIVKTFISTEDSLNGQHATDFANKILPGLQRAGASTIALDATAYRRLLSEKLSLLTESTNRGTGGVQIADLRQYAGVPARMILITGLDDGAFPKRDERPDWHPFVKKPQPGDPSLRDADRHALLLALLSCQERLVLCYRGGSDQDAKERPPSTALADLLGVIDQTLPEGSKGCAPHQQIVFTHPLNGISPKAFCLKNHPQQTGKNAADHRAAAVLAGRKSLDPLKGPWAFALPAEDDFPTTFQMFRKLLSEPAALLLERLGIRLPEEAAELSSGDLIEFGTLEKWGIKDDLLAAFLEGKDPAAVAKRLSAAGNIPRGKLGESLLLESQLKLAELMDKLAGIVPLDAAARVVQGIRLSLEDPSVPGRTIVVEGIPRPGWYRVPGGSTLLHVSPSGYKSSAEKRKLSLLVESLGIVVALGADGATPPNRLNAHFSDDSFEASLPCPALALQMLRELLPLLRLARQYALPFWPGVADFPKWSEPSFGSDAPPPCLSPATRYAFRGCWDPFEWNADGLPSWLPEEGKPFATRVGCFIDEWRKRLPEFAPKS